ncbi:MAG TPA: SulP family inorganic anion transporter, partial [Caulifigura sp.]|nr:SulP family inorganic anion transporter [Caulifigura sp.]
MNDLAITSRRPTLHDFAAGLVVFLVAMPLCMGIATASNAPAVAGLISGIVGGIVVGLLSGSATSVTGPAGGLIPIVALQIASLGSFQAFLLAAVVAGVIQIVLGIARLGFLASFAPTSVVKGLLAAIGIIIVLKQIPHLIGNDLDPQGEMSFFQTNQRTTFSAIMAMFAGFHPGAAVIGFVSLGILILWGCSSRLKQAWIPGSLVAMAVAVVLSESFSRLGPQWAITGNHLLNVPVPENGGGYLGYLTFPDFAQWNNPDVYRAAFVIAVVGSLESLLSLEAIDRIDPLMRESPTNRELIAQGVGNSLAGLIGGIPMTIVIIRSSIGLSLGARTRATTIVQGVLLLAGLTMFPGAINRIPLAAIAAVLIASGSRLANPQILRRLYVQGGDQFLPFLATVVAIVLTDVLTGLLIGLAISTGFVLRSNLLRPMRRIRERHPSGEVLRIELPNQVSFLNKASLERSLMQIPPGGHVVIDGRQTDSIDSDVRALIEDFREKAGP